MGQGLVRGGDLGGAGMFRDRLCGRREVLFKFRINGHACLAGQSGGFAHAVQPGAGGFHDEGDVGGAGISFAVVVGITINLTEAGDLQSHAELHRSGAEADAGASFCGDDCAGQGIVWQIAGVEGFEAFGIERCSIGLMRQDVNAGRVLGKTCSKWFGILAELLRRRVLGKAGKLSKRRRRGGSAGESQEVAPANPFRNVPIHQGSFGDFCENKNNF